MLLIIPYMFRPITEIHGQQKNLHEVGIMFRYHQPVNIKLLYHSGLIFMFHLILVILGTLNTLLLDGIAYLYLLLDSIKPQYQIPDPFFILHPILVIIGRIQDWVDTIMYQYHPQVNTKQQPPQVRFFGSPATTVSPGPPPPPTKSSPAATKADSASVCPPTAILSRWVRPTTT